MIESFLHRLRNSIYICTRHVLHHRHPVYSYPFLRTTSSVEILVLNSRPRLLVGQGFSLNQSGTMWYSNWLYWPRPSQSIAESFMSFVLEILHSSLSTGRENQLSRSRYRRRWFKLDSIFFVAPIRYLADQRQRSYNRELSPRNLQQRHVHSASPTATACCASLYPEQIILEKHPSTKRENWSLCVCYH